MSVRIFTKNQLFQQNLENGLNLAQIAVHQAENPDLAIIFDPDAGMTASIDALNCPLYEIEKSGAPYRLGSLIDTIRDHLKRIQIQGKEIKINIGDMVLDFLENSLTKPDRNPITLTEKEVMILAFLYQSHPKPVSRESLLDNVWGYAETVETHTLETHIYRLRQKIEEDPSGPQILVTKEEGYGLNF
jgi:DNA-binding winged helix-turn-helix (wHTH) protein